MFGFVPALRQSIQFGNAAIGLQRMTTGRFHFKQRHDKPHAVCRPETSYAAAGHDERGNQKLSGVAYFRSAQFVRTVSAFRGEEHIPRNKHVRDHMTICRIDRRRATHIKPVWCSPVTICGGWMETYPRCSAAVSNICRRLLRNPLHERARAAAVARGDRITGDYAGRGIHIGGLRCVVLRRNVLVKIHGAAWRA